MSKPLIIGLTGVKTSGKSTAFNIVQETFKNHPFTEIQLAKKLKDVCSKIFYIPRDHMDNQEFKEKEFENGPKEMHISDIDMALYDFGLKHNFEQHILPHIGKEIVTPRHAAQYLGSEVIRDVCPLIHAINAKNEFKKSGSKFGIVTDIRFWDEYNFFLQQDDIDFVLVNINNPGAESRLTDTHASERSAVDIGKQGIQIHNDGKDMLQFRENVTTVIGNVLKAENRY